MAGVFSKNQGPKTKISRNTFDLSHQNNATMRFGEIYPILVEPVLPGDTVRMDLACGIRAMPTAFPVQTKVKLCAHAFYVRNRNLWKDWPAFITRTGNKKLSFPVLSSATTTSIVGTGKLGDYMNLPTTVVGSSRSIQTINSGVNLLSDYGSYGTGKYLFYNTEGYGSDAVLGGRSSTVILFPTDVGSYSTGTNNILSYSIVSQEWAILKKGMYVNFELDMPAEWYETIIDSGIVPYVIYRTSATDRYNQISSWFGAGQITLKSRTDTRAIINVLMPVLKDYNQSFDSQVALSLAFWKQDSSLIREGYWDGTFNRIESSAWWLPRFADSVVYPQSTLTDFAWQIPDVMEYRDVLDDPSDYPSVSALPFRAYESIYNAFYRDERNNPLYVNGIFDPNVYLPTTEGGPDDTRYELRKVNWEQDFLTTAMPTPQQGIAPLVGITSSGVATFALEDGTTETVQLETAEDGDTVTGAKFSNSVDPSVRRSIVNIATSGISINDFRGVNALQRWLETNIRRGYKYKDQIESHFGTTPSYAELDMPEFCGGLTHYFDSSQINQTVDNQQEPLGSYAGQLSCVAGNSHTINRTFDEHGYFIVVAFIVPVPVYTQLMPKDFIKRDPLEYFFPEFGHLGMQPITYGEVAPLQSLLNEQPLESTFGYQRAWYEYMSRQDEAHGDFRTTLRDFLLARQFRSLPSLTPEFLTVDPEQLNDIFTINYVQRDGEQIPVMPFLGQFHFKEIMKRKIPRYGIPRLE
ncbi:major capsid protein [Microvirus mar59]|uniref:Major capsid protein n=1 Tax=Microvirus mar59 TaxID=2851195 RepID=A0A8F5RC46_9VIRU|nr:major capsid protein [Microvirus mar59]